MCQSDRKLQVYYDEKMEIVGLKVEFLLHCDIERLKNIKIEWVNFMSAGRFTHVSNVGKTEKHRIMLNFGIKAPHSSKLCGAIYTGKERLILTLELATRFPVRPLFSIGYLNPNIE
jgi:hypothetical protein